MLSNEVRYEFNRDKRYNVINTELFSMTFSIFCDTFSLE